MTIEFYEETKPEKYTKRPVEVEALRIGKNHAGLDAWPYVEIVWTDAGGAVFNAIHDAWVPFRWGDWIIKGLNGEFYPCKHDVFIRTYGRSSYIAPNQTVEARIRAEMDRQVTKWGPQNWDSIGATRALLPTADFVKMFVEEHAEQGDLDWAGIALEEFCEAIEEEGGSAEMVTELIQTAAVMGSWVESIERNGR